MILYFFFKKFLFCQFFNVFPYFFNLEIPPPRSNELQQPYFRNRASLQPQTHLQTPETKYIIPNTTISDFNYKNASKYKKPQILQQGNTTWYELNQKYFSEAEICFKNLKIDGNMTGWIANGQRWLFKHVLYQFLQENTENIFDLNNLLTTYYGKYLYELQIFDKAEATKIQSSRYSRITVDELLANHEALRRNQTNLRPFTTNYQEIQKINEKMKSLLNTRERLERYIKIQEFENYQIR